MKDIPLLEDIPPQTTIKTAIELIEASSPAGTTRTRSGKSITEPWGIRLGEVDYITANAARYFAKVYNVKNFAYALRTMVAWLETVGKKQDTSFANWFLGVLRSAGCMMLEFPITNSVSISITSLLTLPGESWLDDNIVRCLMALFQREYSNGGWNIFIPPLVVDSWRGIGCKEVYKEWMKQEIQSGGVRHALGIIYMGNHWGALHIDFLNRTFRFGDSLSIGAPRNLLSSLKSWLSNIGEDMKLWSKAFLGLDIAQ